MMILITQPHSAACVLRFAVSRGAPGHAGLCDRPEAGLVLDEFAIVDPRP